MTLRAVVLARGKGTRMQRPADAGGLTIEQAAMADAGLKAMMPFGGRPFLDYVLRAIADAGCTDVCLVVAPEHRIIHDYYTQRRTPTRIRITFAVQEEPRGTADAALAAEPFTAAEPFIIMNADNYYPPHVLRGLVELDGPGLPAFSRQGLLRDGYIEPRRVRNYAVLRIADDGTLDDVIEKPDESIVATLGDEFFVSMNCWRFDEHIFEACRQVPPSPRGEMELPNAVRFAVHTLGQRFRTFPVDAAVLDLSFRSDVPNVAQTLASLEAEP
jgi:dTDP-glucose pyrophosphorylase